MTTNNKANSGNLLDEVLATDSVSPVGRIIDLDTAAQPAVLAGLFDVGVPMIYQYRQDGKLPNSSSASYRQCLIHHLGFWKDKAAGKSSDLNEAATIQNLELARARTESEWLKIKRERGQLVDLEELAEVLEPPILHVRTQLTGIARRNPELVEEIDTVLETWDRMGREMLKKAEREYAELIDTMMESEFLPAVTYADGPEQEAS